MASDGAAADAGDRASEVAQAEKRKVIQRRRKMLQTARLEPKAISQRRAGVAARQKHNGDCRRGGALSANRLRWSIAGRQTTTRRGPSR